MRSGGRSFTPKPSIRKMAALNDLSRAGNIIDKVVRGMASGDSPVKDECDDAMGHLLKAIELLAQQKR